MKKFIFILLLISFYLPAHSQVLITGFGSSEFSVDGETTDFGVTTQTATTANAIGTDTNIFAGTFSLVDITGFPGIELTGFVTGVNPNTEFSVEIFNSDFSESRTYRGFLSSFASTSSSTALTFASQTATFNTVGGFQFGGQGSGSSLNITFGSIAAVPEPSTWVLIAGGLAIILLLRRRRRA